MLGAPTPGAGWHPGSCTQKKPFHLNRPLRDIFSFQNSPVYTKTTVDLVPSISSPLNCHAPHELSGTWKCGCLSWRAHHPLDRSCCRDSAHTPTDVWVWNKSGSLALRWLASAGLRGVESSKISFQSIKNLQRYLECAEGADLPSKPEQWLK